MLFRSIWEKLENWKGRSHHPLILTGLRQTGKTYIVKAFGEENYEHVVYLDLRSNQTIHTAFEGDFQVDHMVMSITANDLSARFIPGKTLLVLDEIQDCPNARSSLKYWDIDGRYDVIATGSFLGVKGFREPYARGIPVGYEETLTMHPLTFHEFMVNAGAKKDVLDYVQGCLSERKHIDNTVHASMRAWYLQYLIVGGMPEAVNTFFQTHDINAVRAVQRGILSSIRDDFGRYKDKDGKNRINETLKLRAEACLDSVPAQLAKEYKKFQYSLVEAKGHSPEKADGLQYLVDVGIVVKAFNIREISTPLEGVKISSEFKVYYADTGLLISQLEEGTAAQVLRGEMSAYKGAVAENMIAAAFASNERDLYYYHASSGSPELDFIYSRQGTAVIVECKSTNNRATSLKYVIAHPGKYGTHPAEKYADTNVSGGDGFITLPLYAAGFIKKEETSMNIEIVELPKLPDQPNNSRTQ